MSEQNRRSAILDPDNFNHFPEIAYIPIEGVDTVRQQVIVELPEMTHGGTALLVYSSRDRLIAARGGDHLAMTLPSHELPTLRRYLGFDVVLLDISLPPKFRRQATAEESFLYVPSRPFKPGDAEARLELQPLVSGHLALLAYTSQQSLLDGCGPDQYYVCFPSSQLQRVMQQCGADRILINIPLPHHLRH